jgi:hypothetical protein
MFYQKDAYNLEGYCVIHNTKKYFCIDSADAPFLFDSDSLDKVSVYFKMQCPLSIEKLGFPLTDKVYIPYCDHQHEDTDLNLTGRGPRKLCSNIFQNIEKIRPLMVGPRRLSRGNGYIHLRDSYEHYRASASLSPTKKLMVYFGNALGPLPSSKVIKPDFDWESDIMAWFSDSVNHPNEKRAEAVRIIAEFGKNYDTRIISQGNADSGNAEQKKELIIPLPDFCNHIAQFQYNFNISGYRMSIPNRFIESFMVGTAIFTDRLKVKWYVPFDVEVIETIEMGYLPWKKVKWDTFRKDLQVLPEISKKDVLSAFTHKWAPEVVAQYIINTILYEC